ncbi:MAG TPA: hypothetical protein DCS52_11775 [Bradyrhizobium sp.]|nr:hypothetical protein [Bradyrhizobium sp.]
MLSPSRAIRWELCMILRKLGTYLGRVIRDIGRKIEGDGGLEAAFAKLLLLARRVRERACSG